MDVDQGLPARFFDGKTARPHPVNVQVGGGKIVIEPTDGAAAEDWPLPGVVAQTAHDGVVTLRRGREPARLVVADPALLQALQPRLRRRLRRSPSWAMVLACCLMVAAAGLGVVDWLPRLLAPLVPAAWEETLGDRAQTALLARSRPCNGAAGQRALEVLVTRVAMAGGIKTPVRITVADDDRVNAFTFPGNRVVVMRGLITASSDGAELAGVLAHELGHVAHHDPSRQALRQLGLGVVGVAFGWGGFDGGSLASTLLGLSYGRAAESDADAFAITALQSAGLRADGLGRFFAKMDVADVSTVPFLSDHPPTAERRARVARPADGAEPFSAAQWHDIGAMCLA